MSATKSFDKNNFEASVETIRIPDRYLPFRKRLVSKEHRDDKCYRFNGEAAQH